MASTTFILVPVSHAPAINRMLNVLFGDSGDNLSRGWSPSGLDPATYISCLTPLSPGDLAIVHDPLVPFTLPEGTEWPLAGGITEQDVADARAELIAVTVTDPDKVGWELSAIAISQVTALTGLILIEHVLD